MTVPHCRLFDAHLHIIAPGFPLIPNGGYLPPPATCEDYLNRTKDYALAGGAVVSGSFQGFDQTYLIAALNRLGPAFVGVTQLPVTVSDQELLALNNLGVRAIRFNLQRGGSEEIRHLDRMARRVHELAGWHVELYVDSRELAAIYDTVKALPSVCIDHLGLARHGFGMLRKLVERGVQVKATSFGRVDFEVGPALQELFAANPAALMFGTDFPSTRAPRPYEDADFALVIDSLGMEKAGRVFYDNAVRFYRPRRSGESAG